jgi:hypothetical protein
MQPRKYSENTFKMKIGKLEDAFRSTRTPAVLDYEELGGFQTRVHGTVHVAYILRDKGSDMAHALH